MSCRRWIALIVVAGCGGDDGGGPTGPSCSLTVSGDVSGASACRTYLCYPTSNDYQSLDIASPELGALDPTISWAIVTDVPIATSFAAGQTLSIDQLRTSSQLRIDANGTTYEARVTPQAGSRNAAETASLVVDTVQAPSGADVCSGWITGTLDASLVEITGAGTANEAVGAGRVQVSVTLAF